jgi:ammonia channel protein AmtB
MIRSGKKEVSTIERIDFVFIDVMNTSLLRSHYHVDVSISILRAVGAHAFAAFWGIIAVGLFADSRFEGIEVRDGLFKGGGFHQLGLQLLEAVAIMCWSCATMIPFFYSMGLIFGGDWKNPRKGLLLDLPRSEGKPHQAE